MEEIVKRLSEIETEAVRIMDDSAVQKKEMDAESEKRLRKYDEESNAKTAAALTQPSYKEANSPRSPVADTSALLISW